MDLDKIDFQLLKLLQKNSKITIKELSNRLNLSNSPIHDRIKRLEKKGYILNYVALLDKKLLNKKLTVFCHITLKEHTKEIGNQFVKEITSLKEVTECYNISGDYDFMLKVLVNDMDDYQDFVLNRLGEIKNIGSAKSTFVMAEIKNTTEIPI